jgi:hypothetical protein
MAGKAKDAPPPADRPTLRTQALEWLTADLTAWRVRVVADPAKYRGITHRRMAHWLTDPDLEPVRARAALEGLPADERIGWDNLWAEVRSLRDHTNAPETAPPPRPVL